jgi:ribose transport system ATP-binding protein
VLGLADRVLVMREGHVIGEAAAGELTESDVLDMVMEGSLSVSETAMETVTEESVP